MGIIGKYKRLKSILENMESSTPLTLNNIQYVAQYVISSKNCINTYERKIVSQNGEDGIIEEIFKRIGTTNKFFVEFGVENGLQCNTGYLAAYRHWKGLFIEGNKNHFDELSSNYRLLPNIKLANYFITKDNIRDVFAKYGVPVEFDLLSIDIDGNDYWIWRTLCNYRPRLVVIEYNAAYAPPLKWVMDYNANHTWDGTTYYGASLSSLEELGSQLGYSLVGTDKNGVNAFFLRNELLNMSRFSKKSAEEAYHPPAFGNFLGGHPWRDGPHQSI